MTAIKALAIGWEGIRIPIVGWQAAAIVSRTFPAVFWNGDDGPGQKRSINGWVSGNPVEGEVGHGHGQKVNNERVIGGRSRWRISGGGHPSRERVCRARAGLSREDHTPPLVLQAVGCASKSRTGKSGWRRDHRREGLNLCRELEDEEPMVENGLAGDKR